jgi:multidrug efflux pump subunit AcrB
MARARPGHVREGTFGRLVAQWATVSAGLAPILLISDVITDMFQPQAQPLVLSGWIAAAVAAVLIALLGWLIVETQGGDELGLAERMTSAAQISWPFMVALALRHAEPLVSPPSQPRRQLCQAGS